MNSFQKQKGSGLVVVGIFAIIVLTAMVSYISAVSYGNSTEKQLNVKYKDNENVLSSGYQQLQGVTGVTTIAHRDDQLVIFKAAIEGRYGDDGSNAVFQMITENNLVQDPKLYQKVQQVVEGTQKEFQASQTSMLDIKRSYETELDSVWKGTWLGFAGYPKANLKKYHSEGASDAFNTGKQKKPDF